MMSFSNTTGWRNSEKNVFVNTKFPADMTFCWLWPYETSCAIAHTVRLCDLLNVHISLVVAFTSAMKLHLRSEPVNEELVPLMSSLQYFKLQEMDHPPLEIAFWIGDYLQQQYNRHCLNTYQLTAMQALLDSMVDILGGCERILKTPIPLAYVIHIKQLLLIYCLLLPFYLVNELGWWTGVFVALISFILFGIEEIGIEIENPFGHDLNDLPLDAICSTMLRNIEDLITLTPSAKFYTDDVKDTKFD